MSSKYLAHPLIEQIHNNLVNRDLKLAAPGDTGQNLSLALLEGPVVKLMDSLDQFMPHGHCFLWRTDLLTLHVASDTLIAFSYFTIPMAILYYIRRKQVRSRLVPVLFVSFILSCGMTHILGVWNFWNADYWVSGFVKALCAGISASTAIFLWILMPKALKLPTTQDVEDLNEQLKEANRDLEQKVQKRTKDLRKVNQELEYILSILSHDFRNGLGVISAYSDFIASGEGGSPQEMAKSILNSTTRLSAMINDLNVLAQMKNVEFSKVDLNKVFENIASDYRLQLDDVEGSIKKENLPEVYGVESLLNQLFSNLFSNSIKYKKPEMPLKIELECNETDDFFEITYSDNGIGIPPEDQERVFEMYARGTNVNPSEKVGLGIGLGFCRRIAELHDGEITVQPSSEGTTFLIRLAKNPSADQTSQPS